MEVAEVNIISNFEAGMNCLQQNPSLISRLIPFSGTQNLPQSYSFWTWGALILALLATFTSVFNRVSKILVLRLRSVKSLASSSSRNLLQHLNDDFDYSDLESDDDGALSSSSSKDDEDDDASSLGDWNPTDEDFRVAGSSFWQNSEDSTGLTRRIGSWSDFAAEKSVVKLWDSFGMNLDFEDWSDGGELSLWDLDRDQKISTFFGGRNQIPTMTMESPAVMLSAESNRDDGGVVLSAYDTRVGRQTPAIYAEWQQPRQGKVVGINSGGVKKVYVDGGGLTVGDMRKPKSPLRNDGGDRWSDADAVIVEDDSV